MKNDEFNKVEIKNEKDGFSIEYGKTQKYEYTFYNDNANKNRDELNPNENNNNENVKKGQTVTNNNDIIQKAVKASTTATNVASATTTVAAGVSVVAVVTVSTLVGISVVSNNNASFQFQYLDIYSESISYLANLYNTNDDKFSIYIENSTFLSYNQLEEGINEGYFEGLTAGETYRIYVKEDSQSGKIIYDEKFTTSASTISPSYINGLDWDLTADYINETIELRIDYYDEENRYSDFVLELSDKEVTKVYPLELTDQKQTIIVNKEEDEYFLSIRNNPVTYKFIYKDNGEEIVLETNEVTFIDNSGAIDEISDFEIDELVDITSNEFEISLTYQDDLDYISNVQLHILVPDNPETESIYQLLLTNEKQQFTYENASLDSDYTSWRYIPTVNYYLTYEINGEETTTSTKSVTFKDSESRVSEFHALTWDKTANFTNRTFELSLDYQDDFGYFDQFKLTLTSTSTDSGSGTSGAPATDTFDLLTQTDLQTVTTTLEEPSQFNIDIVTDSFTYTLTYYDYFKDETIVAEEGEVSFENSLVSRFNSITYEENLVPEDASGDIYLALKMDYIDEAKIYSNFYIVINDYDDGPTPIDANVFTQFTTLTRYTMEHSDIFDGNTNLKLYATVYDMKHDTEEDVLLDEQVINFYDNYENQVYGVNIKSTSIEENNPLISVGLTVIDKDQIYDNYVLVFKVNGEIYTYEIDISGSLYSNITYINLSEESTGLVEALKKYPADIYLRYNDNSGQSPETKEVLSASNIWFEIY